MALSHVSIMKQVLPRRGYVIYNFYTEKILSNVHTGMGADRFNAVNINFERVFQGSHIHKRI